MRLKDLCKGDFFTLRPITNPGPSQVYIKGIYDRSARKYEVTCFDDICKQRFLDGSREVFVDFIF